MKWLRETNGNMQWERLERRDLKSQQSHLWQNYLTMNNQQKWKSFKKVKCENNETLLMTLRTIEFFWLCFSYPRLF